MGNENGRALTAEELKSRDAQAVNTAAQRLPTGNVYNLKVLIKGDRNTGKTCLWNILQRKPFISEYVATMESQRVQINWEYKASYDVVTVDVWDVVDKSKRKVAAGTLKVTENDDKIVGEEDTAVMRGAHAIVFVVDPTKKWTFDYVIRELPKVPSGLSTLLLANFKDQAAKWVVSPGEMKALIESAGPHARYLEVSLVNSFGLKGLQLFLNLPFLRLRQAFYEQQLKKCQEEIEIAHQEFDYVFQESNYEKYTKWLSESKKSLVSTTPPATPTTPSKPAATSALSSSTSKVSAKAAAATSPKAAAPATPKTQTPKPAPSTPSSAATQKSPPKPEESGGGGFFSRLFRSESAPAPPVAKAPATPQRDVVGELKQLAKKKGNDVVSVDDFKPEVAGVDDFFGDEEGGPAAPRSVQKEESSSDEENDQVIGDEDVVVPPPKPAAKPQAPSATAQLTNSAKASAAKPSSQPTPAATVAATPKPATATTTATTTTTTTAKASAAPASPPLSPPLRSSAPASTPSPPPPIAAPEPKPAAPPAAKPVAPVARPSVVDDFRPDDGGVDDFFSSPAPTKPAAKATAAAATTLPPPAPKPKYEESDSDDDNKPNPLLMQDEDVGDDSVAIQKKVVTELPKSTLPKSTAALSWRQMDTAKPAPTPAQPKVSIDINALMAGFLQDSEPAGGFEAIPEDVAPTKKKPATKKKKAAAAATATESGGESSAAPKKKKAGVKKKKAAAVATTADEDSS